MQQTCIITSRHHITPINKVGPSSIHPPNLNCIQPSTPKKSKKLVKWTPLIPTCQKITQKYNLFIWALCELVHPKNKNKKQNKTKKKPKTNKKKKKTPKKQKQKTKNKKQNKTKETRAANSNHENSPKDY